MYQIKKRISVVIGIAVVVMASVFIFVLQSKRGQVSQVLVEELSYQPHLETFLQDSGLTSLRKEKNGFTYYELRDTYGDLQGFVFLGAEDGWAGPISLFVKTDAAGIIQRVHVWHHTETPIFVHPVRLREFLNTFANHGVDTELKWQTDIHGLTGATVTAEAIIREVHELGIRAKGIYDIP